MKITSKVNYKKYMEVKKIQKINHEKINHEKINHEKINHENIKKDYIINNSIEIVVIKRN